MNKKINIWYKNFRIKLYNFKHNTMGWHDCKGSPKVGFDGCSMTGICSCGKEVLQDSQGNWF